MKVIVILLVLAGLILTGCSQGLIVVPPEPLPSYAKLAPTPTVTVTNTIVNTVTPTQTKSQADILDTQNWVYPGKVQYRGYRKGVEIVYTIRVHNGQDTSESFTLYTTPNNDQTKLVAPKWVSDWVTYQEPNMVLAPRETRDETVTFQLPLDILDSQLEIRVLTKAGEAYFVKLKQDYYDKRVTDLVAATKLAQVSEDGMNAIRTQATQDTEAYVNSSNRLIILNKLWKEGSQSLDGLKGYLSGNAPLDELMANKYVSGGNLLKDSWEFIANFQQSNQGTLVVANGVRFEIN